MDGFEQHRADIESVGGKIVASSVDDIDNAGKIAEGKGFPFGYGVTRDIAEKLGAWWEDRRSIIQPSEFIVNSENNVVASSYSDGPLGRIDAPDVVNLINYYASQKK